MNDYRSIPGLASRLFGGEARGGAAGRHQVRGHPSPAVPVKCPRCDSTNTKFCYYNNYNLAQPRHFCKACRRYWTKGGILRNVPVGGGCRKSKHSSTSKPSGGLASPREPSPSGHSDGPNSAIAASNSDENSNPTAYFNQDARARAPLASDAEIFVETAVSSVLAPTILSDFGALLPISLQCRQMAEAAQIGAQPAYLHQTAAPIPLQPLLDAAEGFMNSAPPPPQMLPIQFRPISVEEVAAQPNFLDQAAVGGMGWSGGTMDPAIFGLSTAVETPAAARVYWSDGQWSDADPALFLS
ncbi:dof zinc finger protein 4-like [Zingiber officinale]|uniref:Dof zinc finger protein n=1 Tax=Zingiber officinale TaxID=94328 RepID=A0A8J5K744_ZINOF|nr:dof zinc finger protein 4-like [Zingiber officinale]KAG6476249.1 hypothetical protein ZIOFF_065488 [Zingiber officinale]